MTPSPLRAEGECCDVCVRFVSDYPNQETKAICANKDCLFCHSKKVHTTSATSEKPKTPDELWAERENPQTSNDSIDQIVRDCTSVEPRAKSEIRRRIENLLAHTHKENYQRGVEDVEKILRTMKPHVCTRQFGLEMKESAIAPSPVERKEEVYIDVSDALNKARALYGGNK